MKKYLLFLFFFIIINLLQYLTGTAQNLVPNWSFETIDTCNFNNANCTSGVDVGSVLPWEGYSADLYNVCSIQPDCGVPFNFPGFQVAHTGNGYVGEYFYDLSSTNYREYIQVALDSVMKNNHKYCCTFYVSLSNVLAVGIDHIGMYISTTHTSMPTTGILNYIPQIIDANIVIDTTNWTLISGEYIANGGEQYIVIGNFNSAATTDTLSLHGSFDSYYYIDDVSVWDCTGSGLGITEASESLDLKISPNPTSGIFTVNTSGIKMKEVKVMNILGEVVFRTTAANPQITIDMSNEANGIYFVEVRTEKGVMRKKFIKE